MTFLFASLSALLSSQNLQSQVSVDFTNYSTFSTLIFTALILFFICVKKCVNNC